MERTSPRRPECLSRLAIVMRLTLPDAMTLFLAICTGIGLALAVGLRPFLPALFAGALARGDAGIDFEGTDVAFLEDPIFLLALLIAVIALVLANQRVGPDRLTAGPLGAAIAGIGLALGALLFGGVLQEEGYALLAGLIGGIACAALAEAAGRGFFAATRARLDAEAAATLPLYAIGVALLLVALAVFAPPVSLLALAFLAWLLIGQRRREGRKYAGLRILR
jgi:Domain of unknown function (DUF4126)